MLSVLFASFGFATVHQNFVFDLHDSMRRARRVYELEELYNTTFKTVTDAYFKGVRTARLLPHALAVVLPPERFRRDPGASSRTPEHVHASSIWTRARSVLSEEVVEHNAADGTVVLVCAPVWHARGLVRRKPIDTLQILAFRRDVLGFPAFNRGILINAFFFFQPSGGLALLDCNVPPRVVTRAACYLLWNHS